jgi:eukaryotic-like serine/threonine-protein kinase
MHRIGWRRIVKELGRGAMGVVYHAIDPHIGRPAAIRTIQPGTLRKPEEQDDRANASFARRARLVFPASSRFTTSVGGGLAYIAMEYADGPTLALHPPISMVAYSNPVPN